LKVEITKNGIPIVHIVICNRVEEGFRGGTWLVGWDGGKRRRGRSRLFFLDLRGRAEKPGRGCSIGHNKVDGVAVSIFRVFLNEMICGRKVRVSLEAKGENAKGEAQHNEGVIESRT
jgi:hypothetical protein